MDNCGSNTHSLVIAFYALQRMVTGFFASEYRSVLQLKLGLCHAERHSHFAQSAYVAREMFLDPFHRNSFYDLSRRAPGLNNTLHGH